MSAQTLFSADEKLKENIEMLRDYLIGHGHSTIDKETPLYVLIKTIIGYNDNNCEKVKDSERRLEYSEGQLDTIKRAFSIIQCR